MYSIELLNFLFWSSAWQESKQVWKFIIINIVVYFSREDHKHFTSELVFIVRNFNFFHSPIQNSWHALYSSYCAIHIKDTKDKTVTNIWLYSTLFRRMENDANIPLYMYCKYTNYKYLYLIIW